MTGRDPKDYPSRPSTVPHTPLTVCIHLDVLKTNFQNIRQFIPSSTKILPVIKADAYGHGAIQAAQVLEPLDIFGFGVASVTEGIHLRDHHIQSPILIMGPLLPDHIKDIIHYHLTPVISHQSFFKHLLAQLPSNSQPFPVHVKIDTGLHRLGFEPQEALSFVQSLALHPAISLQGLLTHFADADNPNPELTNQQIQQFRGFIHQIKEQGVQEPLYHMANSAGILFHHTSHLDMVRPGIMLYGFTPGHDNGVGTIQLQPVMKVTTYIAHLRSLQPGEVVGYNALFRTKRPSQIAVLPIGYTHGFPRHLTGRGHVLIQGKSAPIIGKICMDMMMVDVTDIPHPRIGEEAVLLGMQREQEITARDYANWLDTIPYEILCGIGGKAQRTFLPAESSDS